jgi:hypothetical protein
VLGFLQSKALYKALAMHQSRKVGELGDRRLGNSDNESASVKLSQIFSPYAAGIMEYDLRSKAVKECRKLLAVAKR